MPNGVRMGLYADSRGKNLLALKTDLG